MSYAIDEARLDEHMACAEMFRSLMEAHSSIPEVFAVTHDVVPKKAAEYTALVTKGLAKVFVARSENIPVGMAVAYIKYTQEYFHFTRYGLIADVYVMPDHRRRGIARKLTKACIDYFKSKEVTTVRLTNSVENEAADKTWENLGFREALKIRILNIGDAEATLEGVPGDERIPCTDDTCVGTIGPDGRCRYCGKPGPGHSREH